VRDIMRIIVAMALVLGCISGITGAASAAGGGSVTGFVYSDNGTQIEGAEVYVYTWAEGTRVGWALTEADGSYTISGLSTREYRVMSQAEGHLRQYYDNVTETRDPLGTAWNNATPVAVSAPGETTGIDFYLTPGGSVSGFVYSDNGTPIEGAQVVAYDNSTGVWEDVDWSYTDNVGSYSITRNMQSGDYRIKAEAKGYLTRYYDNVTDFASADLVTVTVPGETSGINFNLPQGGSISGTVYESDNVTPIEGALVSAYDNATGDLVCDEYTDSAGSYALLYDIYSANYRIEAKAEGYLTRYYDNVTDPASATLVPVTAPNAVSGINFALPAGGTILGTVYESDNVTPIPGALVKAYDNATGTLVDDEVSGLDGSYALSYNVYPANYVVKAEAGGFVTEYYDNVSEISSATLVSVAGADNVPGINFTLLSVTPRVSTNDAGNITTTSATLNGNLTSLGTATSVIVSFEWGTTAGGPYPSLTDNQTMTDAVAFSANLTGLTPGTTYYYRAKAVGNGTIRGAEKAFTALTTAPSVTTDNATNVATTSATLNGNLTDLGTAGSVIVSFEWGTNTGSYTQTTDNQTLSAIGLFSANLTTGLTPGTTYYYRAKAVGDGTPQYGTEKSFTTLTTAPSVTTDNATSVATISATLNGNLTALGTATSVIVSFEWGTTAGGPYTSLTDNQTMTSAGAFPANLTGLTPGTTYYYKAKAVGDATVRGDEMSFTTSTMPPSVTTDNTTSLATTSATLKGNLTALGTATSVNVSFQWGTTTSYGSETTPQSVSAIGIFSANLTGLTAHTTYHFRAKAVGDGSAVYGDDMTFTTASLVDTTAPVISAVNSSNLTVSGATITWTTNEAATTQVKYGLTEEYDLSTTEVTSLVTSHSVDLTGLKAGKTYHYQVISKDAANNQAVSADAIFTTAASSGGMPTWAWVITAIAGVAVVGAAAFFIRGRLAQQ